jgi:hypothetical protein
MERLTICFIGDGMTKERLLQEIQRLQGEAMVMVTKTHVEQLVRRVDYAEYSNVRAGCLNLLQFLGNAGQQWVSFFDDKSPTLGNANNMKGALAGIYGAVLNDMLISLETLVLAKEFGNLLEQADHLFENGYFLAAGVLGRAVLEDHLRTWCQRVPCIPVPPNGKPPTLNDFNMELYRKDKISKTTMLHVTTMGTIGNDAAHNKPELKQDDVKWFLRELGSFLTGNPLP